jgi:hypothetical protein
MKDQLCKYAEFIKFGKRVMLFCQTYNYGCGFCRWCVEEGTFKMISNWQQKCKNGEVK